MTKQLDPDPHIDLRCDAVVDMGYLYLGPRGESAAVVTTRTWEDEELRVELGLDFDKDGYLIGIELFSMSHLLRPEVIAAVTPYRQG